MLFFSVHVTCFVDAMVFTVDEMMGHRSWRFASSGLSLMPSCRVVTGLELKGSSFGAFLLFVLRLTCKKADHTLIDFLITQRPYKS